MAALPEGGITLSAKGFRDYIKKLDEIDKKQRAVFERDFAGTDRSYKQIVSASKQYERQLQREEKAVQRLQREEAKLTEQRRRRDVGRGIGALSERETRLKGPQLPGGLGGLVPTVGVAGIAVLAKEALQAGIELSKQAAAFDQQRSALNNLAAAYGTTSGAIVEAMRKASNGVLSNSTIITAANKTLLLEVAQTPEEFERVTRNAIVLGRALGIDAADSIDQFTTALGRKSIQILDNFGLKMSQVNAEIDRLGKERFGVGIEGLSQAQKDLLFVDAALAAADKRVAQIGESADTAADKFARLSASSENLGIAIGQALEPLTAAGADALATFSDNFAELINQVDAGARGFDDAATLIGRAIQRLGEARSFEDVQKVFTDPIKETDPDLFQDVAQRYDELKGNIESTTPVQAGFGDAVEETTDALEENNDALKAQERAIQQQQQAVRQAEQIALNFARAQEDAARNLARSEAKAGEKAAKDRQKLLSDQAQEFEDFQRQAAKDRAKFEQDAAKKEGAARQQAAQQQVDEQRKLQLQLRQAEQRFQLDRLQSQRRFQLQDEDLRAAGDILGLRSLRRDFALQQQEAAENFDLQQSQTRDSASEEQRQAQVNLDRQLQQIRDGLAEQRATFEQGIDERRAELLASFDEELLQQQQAQAEQREQLRQSYAEQLEDLQLNRQRQLEDLGRSLVEQEDLTKEGAQKIADQLEAAFGEEGVADVIMSGFAERQASAFQQLFDSITGSIEEVGRITGSPSQASPVMGTAPSRRGRLSFHDGGMVPGPVGSEVPATLLAGESVNTIGQTRAIQSMRMLAGAGSSSSSRSALQLSGGFHVSGSGTITDAQIDQISERVNRDVVENYRIALQRRKGRR